jgi:2-polyprenyl-3-methyl-5-hydroxy-6-metoxy-1,4-benzoquinol methylase
MASPDERKNVKDFFQGYAKEFHDIYTGEEKNGFERFLDTWLRRSMFTRFDAAFAEFQNCGAKSVLDVGCGPGHHDAIMAKKLGIKVTGVDVASSMIEIAKGNADRAGVSNLCKFVVGDFDAFPPEEKFDAALSLGVVEYIKDPGPFVKKMHSLVRKKVVFSLPVKWHVLTPQRTIRYKLRNCPLWFYSEPEIASFLRASGMDKFEIKNLGRDYLVTVFGSEA